jgi:hypothetical protein
LTRLPKIVTHILTDQTKTSYTLQPVSQEDIAKQHSQFHELLETLRQPTDSDMSAVLDGREVVEPEQGLHSETITRLQEKIAAKRAQ